jgi:hypothetical protein
MPRDPRWRRWSARAEASRQAGPIATLRCTCSNVASGSRALHSQFSPWRPPASESRPTSSFRKPMSTITPQADTAIHEKFYSSWMMPDRPDRSCCNKQDCYPTEVRYRDGFWEAKRREDGRYIWIPWEKVESHRNNPDGRNHVCMPPPERAYNGGEVFCFALGAGTRGPSSANDPWHHARGCRRRLSR